MTDTFNTSPPPSHIPSEALDTQHTTHGSSYAYSSPDYPEFYDAWVQAMFSGPSGSSADDKLKNEDIPVFVGLIKEQMGLLGSTNESVNVVDLGTGTGRVVCEVLRGLVGAEDTEVEGEGQKDGKRGAQGVKINIWGIDHSEAMLATARETLDSQWLAWEKSARSQAVGKPTWLCASASEFVNVLEHGGRSTSSRGNDKQQVNENAGEETTLHPGQITLLLLSVGTIHHLAVNPLELLSFLKQLSQGLHPHTGRAVISILDEMVPENLHPPAPTTTSEAQERGDSEAGIEYKADLTVSSKKYPGAIYTKSPTITTETNKTVLVQLPSEAGPNPVELKTRVRTDTWTVSLFGPEALRLGPVDSIKEPQQQTESSPKGILIWEKEMQWSLAVWDEDVFKRLVDAVGLEILEVRKGGFQRWYILGKRANAQ